MEIKVGQWVRFTNGDFMGASNEISLQLINNIIRSGATVSKVANTPQELIKVGDLVEYTTKGIIRVTDVYYKNDTMALSFDNEYGWCPALLVTKILTPNGKDYICQWEVTK